MAKAKKRILVVCQHYWPEPFRLTDVCSYFIDKGYEVDVLCGIPNYPQGNFYDGYSIFKNRRQVHEGVNVHRSFEVPRGASSALMILINNLSFIFSSIFHIPRLLTKRYDHILIYQLSPVMMSFSGILIGKIKKIPTTMWVIDLWPDNAISFLKIKNSIVKKVLTVVSYWHYRNVDRIVSLTESMREPLLKATYKSPEDIISLPMACEKLFEEEIYDQELAERFKDSFNVLFTGTITPIISFETVLEAAKILRKRGLKDIHWVIVGDGMSKGWLEEQVKVLGLGNNFHFEGHKQKEEIPKYTTNVADVLLSTLIKDDLLKVTIPSKITSYLASGKPLVLAMDGEAQTLINDTIQCGFAGPAEDGLALADNIEKLFKMTQKQRDELGRKAKTYHSKYMERNLVMKRLEKFMIR